MKKSFVKALAGKKDVMDSFATPAKEKVLADGPMKGKMVRVIDENHVMCGAVIDVASHIGDQVFGQSVIDQAARDFFGETKVKHVTCQQKSCMLLGDIKKQISHHIKF